MSTLDDLRATLAAHAPAEDTALPGRIDSVRSRVTVVRRRRRAAAVVGAVAAIAVVAAGVALPRLVTHRGEAELAAATSLSYGGFEFDLVKVVGGEPGQRSVTATIPTSNRRTVIVLLGEHLDGGAATLQTEDKLATDDYSDRIVDDGAGLPVEVSSDTGTEHALAKAASSATGPRSEIGIAVYRQTATMPQGVVDATGSSVFRQKVGDRSLLAGAFAAPGEAEQTISFTGALSEVRISGFCSVPGGGTSKRGPWVHVSIDGDGAMSSECGSPTQDAALGTAFYPAVHEIKAHVARVWVSRTEDGGPEAVAGAVVGVAVYSPGRTVQVHGSTIDEVVEYAGRLWRLDDVIDSKPGAHQVAASWTGLRDHLLVGYALEGTRQARTGGTVQGAGFENRSAATAAATRSSSVGGVVLPGPEASYDVTWPSKYAGADGAILVYRPAD